MKIQIFSLLLAVSAITFTACGNSDSGANKTTSETNAPTENTASNSSTTNTANSTASPISEVLDHYLHVKNALANDNGIEAANGAKALVASIGKVDQTTFTEEQKKVYLDVAENLKEGAEHTAANANKIDHQREHFVAMSEDVHDLVKAFGTNKTLYLDHCPMANNDKGANWISETEEIKNPYMGAKMPKCGKVEHVIKQ